MREFKSYIVTVAGRYNDGIRPSQVYVNAFNKRDAVKTVRERLVQTGTMLRSELKDHTFVVED